MKRVLITVPDFEIGGFVSHTCNLATALRGRGYHVSALMFEPFGNCLSDLEHALDEVHIVWRGWESPNQFLHRVIGRIQKLAPDVLINNSVAFAQAALPFIDPAIVRMSVVHSIVEREQRLALIHRESLDWLIAVADNVASHLQRLAPDWKRIQTISVGVETLAAPDSGLRRPHAPVRLVYLGRLAPEKNLPALMQVLGQLDAGGVRFQMTIIGSGPEEAWLRSEVARHSFAQSIELKGAIPHREVLAELAQQDILLMTSRYEGTPHVVLEAMSCGLVVVCSNLPGSTDRIITHGEDGFLCDPAAPATFADAIRELIEKPERFGAVSEKARQTIRAEYSTETIGNLYHECIVNARRQPLTAPPWSPPSAVCLDPALAPYCPGFFPNALHYATDLAKQVLLRRQPVRLHTEQ